MGETGDVTRRPTAIDLFCGAGGMSLGFEAAGFDVLVAVDHDPVHLCTYSYNFPDTEVMCSEMDSITGDQLRTKAEVAWRRLHETEWDGELDCVFGGPSCQGFSFIGKNDPDDPRNDLVFQFARIVNELQPRFFVMENVPGLLSERHVGVIEKLKCELSKSYVIDPNGPVKVDAADCGVPQMRRRVFLVGARRDLSIIPSLVLQKPIVTPPTVDDALRDLPDVDAFELLLHSDCVRLESELRKALDAVASDYAKAMRTMRYGRAAYPRRWDRLLLSAAGRTIHSPDVKSRFAELGEGELDDVSRLRRLAGKRQSYTLRAGTGRDHGSFTSSRPIHHVYDRVITVREAARLHSFPDWFRFHTTKWHGFRQVGNAVPPRMAESVASVVVRSLQVNAQPPTCKRSLGDADLLSFSLVEAAEHLQYDASLLPYDVRRKKPTGPDELCEEEAS